MPSIIVTTIGISAFVGFCLYLVAKAHHNKPFSGPHKMIGQTAKVKQWSGDHGVVHLQGNLGLLSAIHRYPYNPTTPSLFPTSTGLFSTLSQRQHTTCQEDDFMGAFSSFLPLLLIVAFFFSPQFVFSMNMNAASFFV